MNKKNMWIIVFLVILALLAILIFWKDINLNKFSLDTANKYMQEKEYGKAEKIYLKFLNNKNEDYYISVLSGLGKINYNTQKYEESKDYFKELLNFSYGAQVDPYIYLALIAEKEKDCDLAIEYIARLYENVSDISSEKSGFLGNIPLILSKCYLEKGDSQTAEKYIQEYLSVVDSESDDKARALCQLGNVYMFEGKYEEAKNTYLDSNKISDNLSVLEKNDSLLGMMSASLALKDYSEIASLSQDFNFSNGNLNNLIFGIYSAGIANLELEKFDQGREDFNKLLKSLRASLDIDDFYDFYYASLLGYYGLGKIDLAEENYENAQVNFEKMEELIKEIPASRYEYFKQKSDLDFLELLVIYEKANLYYLLGDKNNAGQYLKEAISFIQSLDDDELEYIKTREIGNNGFIIAKINSLNLKLSNKTNEEN